MFHTFFTYNMLHLLILPEVHQIVFEKKMYSWLHTVI